MEWININVALPPLGHKVLCLTENIHNGEHATDILYRGLVSKNFHSNIAIPMWFIPDDIDISFNEDLFRITHWMELPPLPNK